MRDFALVSLMGRVRNALVRMSRSFRGHGNRHARGYEAVAALLVIGLATVVSSEAVAQAPSRPTPPAGKLVPMRVRIVGLPANTPLVRVTAMVEATGEQIPRSIAAGVVRSILAPAGLVTVSGDTVLIQRDSSGPAIYVAIETGQLTLPDTSVATVRYAPITGTAEVRTEGGPPGLISALSLNHTCAGRGGCLNGVGETSATGTGVAGIANTILRVAPALAGVWAVETGDYPTDTDGASKWCPSPAKTTFTVEPGRVTSVTIRYVKRKACN